MIKLKQLRLQNYRGYRDILFDFMSLDGGVKNLSLFYGPNGIGKSSILEAINILASPNRYIGRDMSFFFRKMAFHPDYDPTYAGFIPFEGTMEMDAMFTTPDGDKRVFVRYDSEEVKLVHEGKLSFDKVGIVVNEMPIYTRNVNGVDKKCFEHAYYSDADNPSKTCKFQVNAECKDMFLDIAKAVYGFDCWLKNEVEEFDVQTKKRVFFYTDFVIHKDYDDVKVHFKSMSAGERKIATLLAMLCSDLRRTMYDIYLIDNVAMHVYYTRHTVMLEKLREHFPDKQIIGTTHSGEMIRYLPEESLYNIENHIRLRRMRDNAENEKQT